MTQDEKALLLKDLCARVPYGVKVNADDSNRVGTVCGILNGELILSPETGYPFERSIEYTKPYLLPLASMTHEQKEKYCQLRDKIFFNNNKAIPRKDVGEFVNFFYENNLDFNGLIPMGLAIDATNLNIY